ncbi:MAG: T9SS type A sorting domain-containing protein [Fibrobacteria bacterium]|nr:T9SS type A sorting domain-containing protein [Fibrobacteria bacterium]
MNKTILKQIILLCMLSFSLYAGTADSSRFGIFGAYAIEYQFFMTEAGMTTTDYLDWVDGHFEQLGAHWTRSNTQLLWDLIDPAFDGNYQWNVSTKPDTVITRIYASPAEVSWLGCIGFNSTTHNPLNNPLGWKNYLQAIVERYNGDGVDDVNTIVKHKHWQIGNEVFKLIKDGFTSEQYSQIVAMADSAIHSVDSTAKICLVAPTSGLAIDTFLVNVIKQLGEKQVRFDMIDVHHWGKATNYRMTAVPLYRQILDNNGYTQVEIWSTENGTHCYQPPNQPFQTQEEQASSLIRRYVWNFANGLDVLMWNNLMEWYKFAGDTGSIFNSMGLIGDGRLNGEPSSEINYIRKNYYSYRLLASRIDHPFAQYKGKHRFFNGKAGNYGYTYGSKIIGKEFSILWTDNDSAVFSDTIQSGYRLVEMVPYESNGNVKVENLDSGITDITLYKNQVYLLESTSIVSSFKKSVQRENLHIRYNYHDKVLRIYTKNSFRNTELGIYNSKGKLIKQVNNIHGKNISVHNADYPEGIYYIRLMQNNQVIITEPFIVLNP